MFCLADFLEEPSQTPEALKPIVSQYLTNLQRTSDGFESQVTRLTTVQRAAVDPVIDSAREHLGCLKATVLEIEQSIGEVHPLDGFAAIVREGTDAVNRAFIQFRDGALSAAGPTRVSGVNLILSVMDRILSGGAGPEALEGPLGQEALRVRGVLADLDPKSELAVSLSNLLSLINRMLFIETGAQISPFHSELRKAANAVDESLDKDGVSPLGRVNVLLRTAQLAFERRIEQAAGALQTEADRLGSDLQNFVSRLTALDPPLEAPLHDRLIQAITEFEMATMELISGSLGYSAAGFNSAREVLLGSSERLHLLHEEIVQSIEAAGQRSCIRCQASNSPDRTTCATCGTVLPELTGESHRVNVREGEGYDTGGGDDLGPSDFVSLHTY